jgi:hypothetical protein
MSDMVRERVSGYRVERRREVHGFRGAGEENARLIPGHFRRGLVDGVSMGEDLSRDSLTPAKIKAEL